MVTVNVWFPTADNIGHASVTVGSEYISVWPGSLGAALIVGKGELHTYAQDLADEGGSPGYVKKIEKLNENAILNWWNEFKKTPVYSFQFINCMHTVGTALCIGSPNPLHKGPIQPVFINHHLKLMMFADMLAINPWVALPPSVLPF